MSALCCLLIICLFSCTVNLSCCWRFLLVIKIAVESFKWFLYLVDLVFVISFFAWKVCLASNLSAYHSLSYQLIWPHFFDISFIGLSAWWPNLASLKLLYLSNVGHYNFKFKTFQSFLRHQFCFQLNGGLLYFWRLSCTSIDVSEYFVNAGSSVSGQGFPKLIIIWGKNLSVR